MCPVWAYAAGLSGGGKRQADLRSGKRGSSNALLVGVELWGSRTDVRGSGLGGQQKQCLSSRTIGSGESARIEQRRVEGEEVQDQGV